MNKNKIKNISIILLAVGLIASICAIIWLNNKYSTNEYKLKNATDSLCTVIELNKQQYDSINSYNDSLYSYELNRSDSLYQLLKTKTTTSKQKVTYIYKDSTIIKEGENTLTETQIETKYIDRIIEKEIIKTVHDTVQVSKIDTLYKENTVETKKSTEETKKDVVVNDDLFNIYLDASVKGTLKPDIIPEANIGIIFKEKFYGELGIDYDKGKVNPNAKIGLRLNVF